MKTWLRPDRLLVVNGLLIVAAPFLGLPLAIKNLLLVAVGVVVMVLAFKLNQPNKIKTDHLMIEKNIVNLVPSPLKPKAVRQRRPKTTNLKPIEDHASVV